jgi:hypothetical protein
MLQLYTEQEMLSRLAEMLEKERIAQDITQKELSFRAGIPLPTYRAFLKNGTLSAKNMFKLLFVLQLDEKGENLVKERELKTLEEIRENATQKDRKRVRK